MAKRLFVGNLPYETTEEELRNLFSEVGEVLYCKIITDRETGRSKGFGFVEMADELAQAAIDKFNGFMLKTSRGEDRAMVVNEARPMEERSNDRPRRDFGGGHRDFNRGGDRGGRRDFGGKKSW